MPAAQQSTTEGVNRVLGSAGGLLAAAADHTLGVAEAWSIIQDGYAQAGVTAPSFNIADVSVAVGWANRVASAASAFEAASPTDPITSDMLTYWPGATESTGGVISAGVLTRFATSVAEDGTLQGWMSIPDIGVAGQTTGGLTDLLSNFADSQAATNPQNYEGGVTGIYSVQLMVM